MDLSYGKEYEDFRLVVRQFLEANWPPKGEEADLDFAEKCDRFRGRAIEAGYLARSVPKKYGGGEQAADYRGRFIRRRRSSKRGLSCRLSNIGSILRAKGRLG